MYETKGRFIRDVHTVYVCMNETNFSIYTWWHYKTNVITRCGQSQRKKN